jgi:pimeloyl-ACP methyl ester carboxylesterase
MTQQLVRVNGVELCVETFGDQADPAVLLIHGASASMDFWETPFCERLAAAARFVVRYDHRDTGQSVSYEPGEPQYTGEDLIADAVGLDALGIAQAHVVGLSMGGGIAQRMVLDFPDRVVSVTLASTSPGGPGLPPMSAELQASFAEDVPETDWSDPEAALDALIADERKYSGTLPYDEGARRAFYTAMMARTKNLAAAMTNHWILESGGDPIRPRLGEVAVPALILHGTEDPLFPPGHAEVLAREIPGARLVLLEGAGHELPEPTWDLALREIVAITGG